MRAVLSIGILLLASPTLLAEENPLADKAKGAGKETKAQLELGHLYVEAMQLKKAKLAFKSTCCYKRIRPTRLVLMSQDPPFVILTLIILNLD